MSSEDRSQQYFIEAREQLEEIERDLLLLEQADNIDLSLINEIFRGIHTIKGGADFLGLTQIKELSHAAEDVLDLVRKQQLNLTSEGNNTLLVVTDCLKEMLQDPDKSQVVDISHLLGDIAAMSGLSPEVTSPNETDSVKLGTPSSADLFHLPLKQCKSFRQDGFSLYILEIHDYDDQPQEQQLETIIRNLVSIGYIIDSKTSQIDTGIESENIESGNLLHILFRSVLTRTTTIHYLDLDPKSLHELKNVGVEESPGLPEAELEPKGEQRVERRADRRRSTIDRRDGSVVEDRRGTGSGEISQSARLEGDDDHGLSDSFDQNDGMGDMLAPNLSNVSQDDKKIQGSQSIRVNVEILDRLMNQVGELVLTRNQLKQNVESQDHIGSSITAQRLDIVTSELQESIMSTRMQPLGNILSKFHRIIRDMSNQLGKSVNLVLEGEDVELDKTIIESISDPLTHLVRNAIDHGIEKPDVRHAANKPVNATLSITARQEAGHVVIEISDDGRGIDIEKIKAKAIDQELLDITKADDISEKEILKFIFTPGFSTAEVISDISGRGVGLDVVYTNITKLGGTIDIDTSVDVGTTFRVSLPLTLAIVPSLLISSGGDIFAIPQINLVELVRIPSDQKDRRIEFLGDSAVVRLRDKLLPIVWLDKVLGLDISRRSSDESTNIAVVTAGEFYYGIVVDHFTDSEEIVVKPLGSHLRNCHAYASATILGDGRAALILDINGMAELVNISAQHELENEARAEKERDELLQKAEEHIGHEKSLLIVENSETERFGIELAYVNRIERIRASAVEKMANKQVIKYRGSVLRIFSLDEAAESAVQSADNDHVYLIVFYMLGTEVAVMVSNIVDIVDVYTDVDDTAFHGAGIVGSTIILDCITLLVDLFELVKAIDPGMFEGRIKHETTGTKEAKNIIKTDVPTVLVVEDSVFFQDKLSILLKEMNINILLAEDGQIGWDMLDKNAEIVDLVLMDVEMPNMTGLELSRIMRSDERFHEIPIIMLTSLAKEADIEEGKKAGATEYMIKMDQEMVRQTVNRYLNRNDMLIAGSGREDDRV